MLIAKRPRRLDSVEAYACICMTASCSCSCGCGCDCYSSVNAQSLSSASLDLVTENNSGSRMYYITPSSGMALTLPGGAL